MATNNEQIERIRLQIKVYELLLDKNPDNVELKELLKDAKELLTQISK